MNKHHRIGKHIRGESPVWRQQHKAASNVFFRGLAKALIKEGFELAEAAPEVEETLAPPPVTRGAVWVVSQGEKNEGSQVLRVFVEFDDALECAKHMQTVIGGKWTPICAGEAKADGAASSVNGSVDYITIRRHDIY